MDKPIKRAITNIDRKINELIDGYNTNASDIAISVAGILSANKGNLGEHVTALGTTRATAAPLSALKTVHNVLGADDTVGVALPAGTIGMIRIVINNSLTSHLHVYPAALEKIDAGSNGAGITVGLSKMVVFTYKDTIEGWNSAVVILGDPTTTTTTTTTTTIAPTTTTTTIG